MMSTYGGAEHFAGKAPDRRRSTRRGPAAAPRPRREREGPLVSPCVTRTLDEKSALVDPREYERERRAKRGERVRARVAAPTAP
jgi:hypothetical protein